MTRFEAHALLDAARAGANVARWRVEDALRITGDLVDEQRDDHDDAPIVQTHRPVGSWERRAVAHLLSAAGPFDGLEAA